MIDRRFMRTHPEIVATLVAKKDPSFPIKELIAKDHIITSLQQQLEDKRAAKNALMENVHTFSPEIREKSKMLSAEIKELEVAYEAAEKDFNELYLHCPNLLVDDVPQGGKEQNLQVKIWGEKPAQTPWERKHHLAVGEEASMIDMAAGGKIAGAQFPLYKGQGALLQHALGLFMLNHAVKYGYTPIVPPSLAHERVLTTAGNLPRFKDDVYKVEESDLYLIPTAEVSLTGLYADTIFDEKDLPMRLTAFTHCFRKEAGGYGARERGLIRIHEFEKVELYSITTPDQGLAEHERMIACAEEILQKLGLHYRVMLLAAQDCSFSSAKTYDIEVWMPVQGEYKEVSSASYCTDFQARRAKIRYRPEGAKHVQLAHTLNASSLALPRVFVALLETYQQEDGSILIPDVLKKYME